MKTFKENLSLSKTRIWNLNRMYMSDSESKNRHSCDEKTCHGKTCAYTCKHTCEGCEKTNYPGNTKKVCCV